MLEACLELESEPGLVRVVRRFVDQTVTEWELDPVRDDARLIATELAANAVLHARTELKVTLKSDGFGFLRIEVRDANSRMPSPAGPVSGATSGRGLAVVGALATSWGTNQDGDGKVVWAEIGETSTPESPECVDLLEFVGDGEPDLKRQGSSSEEPV